MALADSDEVTTASPRPALSADVEVDPLAYALRGYSLHVGVGYRHLRADLGAFALELPTFVHGNGDFEASFNGFGIKAHYYPFAEQRRLFLGADVRLEPRGANHAGRRLLCHGLDGVGYDFGAHDVTLGGATYERDRVIVFPTVHLALFTRKRRDTRAAAPSS